MSADELASLRRWKAEALEVITGLQALGRALDIGVGEQITGPRATERAAALSARAADLEQRRDVVVAMHKSEPADVSCDAEEYSLDHYPYDVGGAYWIRRTRVGRHDEHSDSGNTGLTWPLSDEDRQAQAEIPMLCQVDHEAFPCRTVLALGDA